MNKNEIKEIYFRCNCNTGGVARDYGFNIDQIRIFQKIVQENELIWTNEFLDYIRNKIRNKKIENTLTYGDLMIDLFKFEAACKSYDDIYELSLIYYQILLNENKYRLNLNDLKGLDFYYYYYNIFLFNERLYIVSLNRFKEKTLLEYLKLHKPFEFNQTIKNLKFVISKDKYKDTYHKEILDILKDYF